LAMIQFTQNLILSRRFLDEGDSICILNWVDSTSLEHFNFIMDFSLGHLAQVNILI
jgi:hypothetical protein